MKEAELVTPMHLKADFAQRGFRLVNNNEVRELWECNMPSLGCSLQCLVVKDKKPIGKDAHTKRWKFFKILTGGGKILTALTNKEGEMLSVIMTETLTAGDVRPIVVFEANTLYLERGTILLCFSSEPFDKTDSIPCPWLTEETAANQGGP